jgi:hypothetical protein
MAQMKICKGNEGIDKGGDKKENVIFQYPLAPQVSMGICKEVEVQNTLPTLINERGVCIKLNKHHCSNKKHINI